MSSQKSLFEIQSLLQEAVQQQALPVALASLIKEKPPISTTERLKIYQDAYQIRLVESLRDDFSRVESEIGDENFRNLALSYIRLHPSRFQNLAEYSEGFPAFVHKTHPELEKLAVIDWLEILSTQAGAPTDQIKPEQIQEGRKFKLKIRPSTFSFHAQGSFILVYRGLSDAEFEELHHSGFKLLQFLQIARSVEEISDFALQNQIHENDLLILLHDWTKKQIIYSLANN